MRKILLPINELRFINEFFDGEVCLCGGIADFIYIGYQDITDIDFIIQKPAFMRSMEINSIEDNLTIVKHNFNIHTVTGSFFRELAPHEYLYAGLYKHYRIDLFVVKEINSNIIFNPENTTKKYEINITSIADRILKFKNVLDATYNDINSGLSNKWLEKKNNKHK